MKQSQGTGRPNKIYIKIPIENCLTRQTENSPTGQTEKCLTGRAFFDPKSGRNLPPNNNKRNKYIRNYDFKEGESLTEIVSNSKTSCTQEHRVFLNPYFGEIEFGTKSADITAFSGFCCNLLDTGFLSELVKIYIIMRNNA